jgi:hypothetical protein
MEELGSIERDGARKTDSGGGDQVSDNTEHTDASVLDLHVTKMVELLLVSTSDQSEGIEEAKRRLGTELVIEGAMLRAVEALPVWAGAKAAAPAIREATMASFIFSCFLLEISPSRQPKIIVLSDESSYSG